MNKIVLENYTKIINRKCILNNINMSLDSNKIYGFIGRNGSGKTMLLRAFCGLIKPTKGRILIDGMELTKDLDFPPSCGAIIETPGFWNEFTGFECLQTIARIKKIISDTEIKKWMEAFELDSNDKRPYRKYSLGMKQKLALVQAFMERPDLIILDEPTNALDENSIKIFRDITQKEHQRGATILLASHQREDINILCNEVYLLKDGYANKLEE